MSIPWAHGTPPAKAATDDDWGQEFLAPILAVRVVDGLDGAMAHVARYGSGHTEAICTPNEAHAARWRTEVDAVETVAGCGESGSSIGKLDLVWGRRGISDGRLQKPRAMAIDDADNLYIVDSGNNRVLEIPKTAGHGWGYTLNAGDIYTVAGSVTGTAGHTGDGSAAYTTALLDGLKDHGAREIFGIPGDFVLPFFKAMN